jgi:hypothetical protein
MRVLQRIWNDLRSGENIDLYITVVVAISLAILNVVGVAPQTYLAPITLAVLGLLAITSLGNRYRIEELLQGQSRSIGSFYMEEYPSSYRDDFKVAEELWLIGVSLRRTVNYRKIEQKLRKGHKINILLVHPEGAGIEMAVARNYARREVEPKSSEIRFNLQLLCDLGKISPEKLKVRTIQYPLAYGVTAVNPDTASGVLYLEHYCFRTASDSLPRFVLRAGDGQWYDFFKKEIRALWDAGVGWPCDSGVAG